MKDQKIELPPFSGWIEGFSEADKHAVELYAHAAIEPYAKRIAELEAERKRRGEPEAWKEISLDAISRMRAGHVGCTDLMNRAEALLEAERISPPPADPEDDKLNLDRLADYIADNWPDKKYSLEEIAQGLHATWPGAFMPAEPVKVPSDADIDAIFYGMPNGVNGWLKDWGYRQFARALLARYGQPAQPTGKSPLQVAAQPSVQPGWQLVPVEPSIAMCIRGAHVSDQAVNGHAAAQVYAAMLNAAPTPPADEQAQQEADPCPQCIPGGACRTPACGRLRKQQQDADKLDAVLKLVDEFRERLPSSFLTLVDAARAGKGE